MEIRRARADEWEALRDIRLSALADSPDAFWSTLAREREADEANWRGWVTGDGWAGLVATFVAAEGDRLLGMATGFYPEDEPSVAHLFAMWVAPERRKAGIGRELVDSVVGWAAERQGVRDVELRVATSNEPALHLYRSCSFEDTTEPPEPLRDGSSLLTTTMRRRVAQPADRRI